MSLFTWHKYEISHVKQGYGYTGLIKEFIVNGDFDLNVGDFTATKERSSFVDFSCQS